MNPTSEPAQSMGARFLIFCLVLGSQLVLGCGVRGRPLAPLESTPLGHGQPSFKRSTEEYAFPRVQPPEATPTPFPNGKNADKFQNKTPDRNQIQDRGEED